MSPKKKLKMQIFRHKIAQNHQVIQKSQKLAKNLGILPFYVARTCPVEFQNRERGIELCRSRN